MIWISEMFKLHDCLNMCRRILYLMTCWGIRCRPQKSLGYNKLKHERHKEATIKLKQVCLPATYMQILANVSSFKHTDMDLSSEEENDIFRYGNVYLSTNKIHKMNKLNQKVKFYFLDGVGTYLLDGQSKLTLIKKWRTNHWNNF